MIRYVALVSLLFARPAYADMRMSEALALSCLHHFRTVLTKEAAAFCSCYPNTFLTAESLQVIEDAQGNMNQELRMLMDQAGDECLKGKSAKFISKAREWIEK